MTPLGLGLTLLGLLAVATWGDVPVVGDVLPDLIDIVDRGRRLVTSTKDADGIVQESAAQLAAAASAVVGHDVTEDAIAGAYLCRSEEGAAGQVAKTYLVHVMLNQADAAGLSLVEIVEHHNTAKRNGHFGPQISGAVSSAQDPYENDLAASEYALAERAQGQDPTSGAQHFVDKRAFGVQVGAASSFDTWLASSSFGTPGNLPSTSGNLVFFWPGDLPEIATALS